MTEIRTVPCTLYRFVEAVYVLHIFQKKSKRGIATPQDEISKIRVRFKLAEELHRNKGRK